MPRKNRRRLSLRKSRAFDTSWSTKGEWWKFVRIQSSNYSSRSTIILIEATTVRNGANLQEEEWKKGERKLRPSQECQNDKMVFLLLNSPPEVVQNRWCSFDVHSDRLGINFLALAINRSPERHDTSLRHGEVTNNSRNCRDTWRKFEQPQLYRPRIKTSV